MEVTSKKVPREQLNKFIPDHRSIVAFENLQDDNGTVADTLSNGQFLVLQPNENLGSERILAGSDNVTLTDGGAGEPAILDLTDTGVTAATYGASTKLVDLAIDAKGRVTSASEVPLESGNVTETTKLFFTNARARSAISATGQVSYNSTTGVINTTGFTGTGTYTNFTIANGVITAAS